VTAIPTTLAGDAVAEAVRRGSSAEGGERAWLWRDAPPGPRRWDPQGTPQPPSPRGRPPA